MFRHLPNMILTRGGIGSLVVAALACGGQPRTGPPTLIHLADSLAGAQASCAAAAPVAERTWSFDQAQGDWRPLGTDRVPRLAAVRQERAGDGLRLTLERPARQQGPFFVGGLEIDLGRDGSKLRDWETLLVRARSSDRFAGITVVHNVEEKDALPDDMIFVRTPDSAPPIFNDGSVQTYAIPLRPRPSDGPETALQTLAFLVGAPGRASLDILSIRLVPRGAGFGEDCGATSVDRGGVTRAALYAHLPSKLAFRVAVPAGGRLDTGLGVLPGESVRYRITGGRPGEEARVLSEEEVSDATSWRQISADLAGWANQAVDLTLEASGQGGASIALWGAPVVAGGKAAAPNVIFYVIDGGGADLMSVYGYNRRTTPFLERLAAEAVVFERAFSNSTWTQSSTASFMTSLQHSVLGGLRRGVHSTPVPVAAKTMAERMRAGGYQTAVFTTNPNAARLIGLQRGVDLMVDTESEHHSTSSAELHEHFWRWRAAYPGAPYWAHFQTTDVHEPNHPVAPFAGLYVSQEDARKLEEMEDRLWQAAAPFFGTTSISGFYDLALERAQVDRFAFFNTRRGLYDETMAYQDQQLGRFVERLKAEGEWENTIFIVAADHGHPAGTFARFGRGLFAEQPEPWQGALFDSYATRVPLIVSWPGRIPGGRRMSQPVSMIDLLPTILDLAALPAAEVAQGQSLGPLLRGAASKLRPVILDEFRVDERSGEMIGNLEIVDGRWGASLEIGPAPDRAPGAGEPEKGRHSVPAGGRWGAVHPFFPHVPRLLLYDLSADPFALKAVNDRHPELVDHYRRLLATQWKAHQALATRFAAAEAPALTPEQLQQLRALGYIQ